MAGSRPRFRPAMRGASSRPETATAALIKFAIAAIAVTDPRIVSAAPTPRGAFFPPPMTRRQAHPAMGASPGQAIGRREAFSVAIDQIASDLELRGGALSSRPLPVGDCRPPPEAPVSFQSRWNARYEELVEYRRVHGDCLVPQQYGTNPALGRWVRSQRVERSCLRQGFDSYTTPDRIDRLDDLGFVWDAKVAKWDSFLKQLRRYRDVRGHCHVPQGERGEYRKLALWVRNQRMHYAYMQRGEGDKSSLTPERIRWLEDLGFIWDVNEVVWLEKFEQLGKFIEEFGHGNVPSSYSNRPLSRWVAQQRHQYRNLMREQKAKAVAGTEEDQKTDPGEENSKRGESEGGNGGTARRRRRCISEKRMDLLNSIGFVWDPSNANFWDRYEALRSYRLFHGDCCVPAVYPPDPSLGHWVANQKRLCRAYGDMVTFRVKELGMERAPIPGLDDERLEALRELGIEPLGWTTKRASPLEDEKGTFEAVKSISQEEPSEHDKTPRTKKLAEEGEIKAFIPFPWDEI